MLSSVEATGSTEESNFKVHHLNIIQCGVELTKVSELSRFFLRWLNIAVKPLQNTNVLLRYVELSMSESLPKLLFFDSADDMV